MEKFYKTKIQNNPGKIVTLSMIPKIILITGASSGIGYDAAQALSRQGHKVYAAARRVELMEPLKELGVVPIRMDVTDEASMLEGVRLVLVPYRKNLK